MKQQRETPLRAESPNVRDKVWRIPFVNDHDIRVRDGARMVECLMVGADRQRRKAILKASQPTQSLIFNQACSATTVLGFKHHGLMTARLQLRQNATHEVRVPIV